MHKPNILKYPAYGNSNHIEYLPVQINDCVGW